ncbi:MAG: group II truncated hemoglobin [Steroidobacteraceae bacterium]
MSANPETVAEITAYEQLGGEAGIRKLVKFFYDDMESSPDVAELRRLHAADLSYMRETLFEFLSGWLGGPRTYFERENAKCMMSAHANVPISQVESDQWMLCMRRALGKMDLDEQTRTLFEQGFTQVCNSMINR